MKRLLDHNNVMNSAYKNKGLFISSLNIIQGDVNPLEIQKSLQSINEKQLAKFVPWSSQGIQVSISHKSPYSPSTSKLNGLMLANHTSIKSVSPFLRISSHI